MPYKVDQKIRISLNRFLRYIDSRVIHETNASKKISLFGLSNVLSFFFAY